MAQPMLRFKPNLLNNVIVSIKPLQVHDCYRSNIKPIKHCRPFALISITVHRFSIPHYFQETNNFAIKRINILLLIWLSISLPEISTECLLPISTQISNMFTQFDELEQIKFGLFTSIVHMRMHFAVHENNPICS